MLIVTEEWKTAHPGACIGLMILGDLANPGFDAVLEQRKKELTVFLKASFPTKEKLYGYGPLPVYTAYYKQYKKTYHVLQQMESVIFKGKQIPAGAALVEAMFMAELKTGLLTAGHDLEFIEAPLTLAAAGDEQYTGIRGREQRTKPGDMVMRDARGILSSILGGPDFRTKITANTKQALFVVYAPPGIRPGTVQQHLDLIGDNIRTFAPAAAVELQEIYTA
ncbi:phenylalanyl-trna synthetase b3/b4 [Lucifera butyrica]|uniref:Phenylalanyl-trna synthetase b3/b4 n=1 Tax=Lucifera butyrica TaxID=1351585 RepID=A0A498REF0_9FIRM|nr:hypothetical protein [Lucifera butyrica]VBB09699.1 phenylalanyl-trna synthetase b3/b4 [Lucifera butyrica]